MASGKLARNGLSEIVAADGHNPVVTRLSGEALLSAPYAKLEEEHAEFFGGIE